MNKSYVRTLFVVKRCVRHQRDDIQYTIQYSDRLRQICWMYPRLPTNLHQPKNKNKNEEMKKRLYAEQEKKDKSNKKKIYIVRRNSYLETCFTSYLVHNGEK